ncbi:sodium-coupled monocarboxylate transporter 1 isoform X1 [Alosa sapidissima]|uniref:sodium-coupled monocarboxylate transporter 1 isoform X1 n=1 Tax=Alosa sapidissima TaxID=34773 RepID=UPI001C08E12E|nr:sodium-coupled monocarboxylate transporter 1 isoform X1 [Alosa sapidissima]
MDASSPIGFFSVWDYAVFALMLLVSAAIGVFYAYVDHGPQSSGDFLMAGRSMTAVPVAMSLSASFMSAIMVLSTPAEIYRFGALYCYYGLSFVLTVLVCSEVFVPVYYRLGITSTYEYLEMRFNRAARLCGTALFVLQTILYTGIVIYVPALALNQVTGFDLWGAVIATGVVCTFYCTLGGLKAVVWTDVLQVGIMVAGLLAVILKSVVRQGGMATILNDAAEGGRLEIWDFDPNPLRRHTFWTITFGGAFVYIGIYGTNQAQVQRYVSCKTLAHAKMSLYVNLIGLWVILLCSVLAGLCLYSVYKHCDPWTSGSVSSADQLMPYLVMDILREHPGLPGLFVAAAYSGTLSTVSSSINALAAVTVEDLVKPYSNLTEKQLSRLSKALSLVYGALCIGMAGLASIVDSLLQVAASIFGVVGGPLLGLFMLGILCPFANATGGLAGLFCGLVLSLWVGIGAQLYPPMPSLSRPLALATYGCNGTVGILLNSTISASVSASSLPLGNFSSDLLNANHSSPALVDSWYSVSYLYFSPIGTLTALAVGVIVSLLAGNRKCKSSAGLTLCKEDLTLYCLLRLLKEKVTPSAGKLDLSRESEVKEKFGQHNPAFCTVELSTTSYGKTQGPST